MNLQSSDCILNREQKLRLLFFSPQTGLITCHRLIDSVYAEIGQINQWTTYASAPLLIKWGFILSNYRLLRAQIAENELILSTFQHIRGSWK